MNEYQQGQQYEQADRGVLILILGILGIIVCGFIAPFAWIMGKGDLAKMDAGEMNPDGRGITQGGMICGIIGTILLPLGIVVVVLILVGGLALFAA